MSETDIQTLTVHFRGICVHFRGTVPGVPHRVVLPKADQMRKGRIKVGVEMKDYEIDPHFPVIAAGQGDKTFANMQPDVDDHFLSGVRMEIVNAINPLLYDDDFETYVLPLTRYVPVYRPSSDVVFGGRAMVYFDIFHGKVGIEPIGEAVHTMIEFQTRGKPRLRITPLVGDPCASGPQMLEADLERDELVVANCGSSCGKTSEFDFLLNYLTADTGLPIDVPADFPLETLVSTADAAPMSIAERFARPTAAGLTADVGTSLSCSDSRYP